MKLYQFETHCHTAEVSPCGVLTAAQIVGGLKKADYMGTFITDHFFSGFFNMRGIGSLSWRQQAESWLAGYRAAKRKGAELGIKVFLGLEVNPDGSPYEFLVYGPDESFIIENGPFYKLTVPELYSLVHDNGFLMFHAHPYRYGLDPEDPRFYDGVEIVNSQPRHESRNKLALKFAFEHDKMIIAGGDVHMEGDVGRGGIMLPQSINSESDFIEYYKNIKRPELIVTYGV
jgi:predicted metal-dependent phosphoesterase TrpH